MKCRFCGESMHPAQQSYTAYGNIPHEAACELRALKSNYDYRCEQLDAIRRVLGKERQEIYGAELAATRPAGLSRESPVTAGSASPPATAGDVCACGNPWCPGCHCPYLAR